MIFAITIWIPVSDHLYFPTHITKKCHHPIHRHENLPLLKPTSEFHPLPHFLMMKHSHRQWDQQFHLQYGRKMSSHLKDVMRQVVVVDR